jgi:hypothetical protein
MTVTAKTLYETVAIAAAETTMYTAPANTRTVIDKHTLTNTTAGAILVTVRLIPSGSVAAGGFAVMNLVSIGPNTSYTCPEIVGHVLNPGDFISILPAAVGINGRASGREVN